MKPVLCDPFQLNGRKKKRKKEKKREVFRVLKYCVQGFEICNVEGSLKGRKKKKNICSSRFGRKKKK